MRPVYPEMQAELSGHPLPVATPYLRDVETKYRRVFALNTTPFTYRGKIPLRTSLRIADAYESMSHAPSDILVSSAYRQLARELMQQFYFLQEQENITFEAFHGKGEPYTNSQEMIHDIKHGHLYFFKTESGFGEETVYQDNIMLKPVGFSQNGYSFLLNDIFRILHDIYGHAKDGYGFGPLGEDKAWNAHMQMFSPLAAAALTTETRGQNSWVNFGPHMRNAKGELLTSASPAWLSPSRRPFAEQKMNLLPARFSGVKVFLRNDTAVAHFINGWDPLSGVE